MHIWKVGNRNITRYRISNIRYHIFFGYPISGWISGTSKKIQGKNSDNNILYLPNVKRKREMMNCARSLTKKNKILHLLMTQTFNIKFQPNIYIYRVSDNCSDRFVNTINFTEKLQEMKNCLFSSHRALRIFLEFFQNFLMSYFLMLKIRKCSTKKLIQNSEKICRIL